MLVDVICLSPHLDGESAPCMQTLQPGNATFLTATQGLERDLEHEIYQILVELRCAPFLESYVATLKSEDRMGSERAMPLGLKAFNSIGGWSGSFHPLNNGIDFRYSNTTWSVYLSSVLVVTVVCTVTLVNWRMHINIMLWSLMCYKVLSRQPVPAQALHEGKYAA